MTLAPSNPAIVWVGTGENVSGRHVAWGTGVYRSLDGGATWLPSDVRVEAIPLKGDLTEQQEAWGKFSAEVYDKVTVEETTRSIYMLR